MRKLLAACSFALFAFVANANAAPFPSLSMDVGVCDPNAPTHCMAPNADGSVNISGSITANLGGFAPNGSYGTLTATAASSASTSLPTGTDVALQNTSTIDVSCVLDPTSATATTNKIIVRGGATVFVTVGTNTKVACINQTGSASNVLALMGGAGLGTNFGGGGAGGGGGAITAAIGSYAAGALSAGAFATGAGVDGWDLTQGAKADSVCATPTGTCSVVALLKFLNAAVNSSIPAGTAIIGKVGIDQSTPGTTNGVSQVASGNITQTLQNAAVANGNGTTLTTSGMSTALLTVNCATCSGGTTINFEVSGDGTNYQAINGTLTSTGEVSATTATAGIAVWQVPVAGSALLRARISGYSAGTVTITGITMPIGFNNNTVAVTPSTLASGSPFVKGTTSAMTGTSSTQVLAAVTAKRLYVTRIKCNNSSGTATLVQIQDGSGGTVMDTLAAGATYGGEQGTGPTPLFWTTAGNGLFAQNVTTSASVICTASGYSGG